MAFDPFSLNHVFTLDWAYFELTFALSHTIWLSGLGVHLFTHLLHWMTTLLWSPEDKAHRWLAAEPKLTLMRKNIPLYPFKKIEAKSATTLLTQKIFTHPHAVQWRRTATTLKPLTVEVNNNALLGNLWSWLIVDAKLEQSPKQCCRPSIPPN